MKLQPSDPDIQTIVGRISSNDLDLQPDFQRGEVWSVSKKRRLIDSILRDWHVPPIHVVVDSQGRQVVLDGQQRLVSIRDFVNDEFTVDGSTEPLDPLIRRLDGLYYSGLPEEVRRAFNQFTIRIFRLTDYSPEEPGELFFRLNQMTYLTAAEQRNAFFGPVRDQVKELVEVLEDKGFESLIGFTNRRMAYDDVIAKLLCTFEVGTLAKRITAGEISNRFRSDKPFPEGVFFLCERSFSLLGRTLVLSRTDQKFNKATLFSWIVFLSSFIKRDMEYVEEFLSRFHDRFESLKETYTVFSLEDLQGSSPEPDPYAQVLFRVYQDRSTSRVSDTTSVILRDLVLWAMYVDLAQGPPLNDVLPQRKAQYLYSILQSLKTTTIRSRSFALEGDLDLDLLGTL